MNEIRSILKIASVRLSLTSMLEVAQWALAVAAGLVLALAVAEKLPAESFVPWMWVGPALAVLALGVTLALWSRQRPGELHVALAVDERLDLREKLSTALHCSQRQDVFARAAVEDAVAAARDPRTHERAKRLFAVKAPRLWWLTPTFLLLAIMATMLPQADLFAKDAAKQPEIKAAAAEAQQSIEAVIKQIKEDPELAKQMADLLDEMSDEQLGADADKLETPEQVKREAIKKVSKISERLEELMQSQQAKSSEVVKDSLSQLKTPEDGPAKELAEAMKGGDFKSAQEALQKLMDQVNKGELNQQQMEQLQQQLQDLADQMQQMAQNQQALQQALQKAGMDPQLAANPQALQQAIQQNQNLNDQQKQQLQQMGQAQQQAQQQCQNMGQCMNQMAQAMQQGQMGQMGQQGQQMQQMLNQLEGMQQMMMQAQAAQGQCQGQCKGLGQGLGQFQQLQQQLSQGQGQGAFGQRGQGQGSQAPKQKTPVGTKIQQDPGKTDPSGEVIFRQFVEGEQVRGESVAQFKAVVANVVEAQQEGISEDDLPRKYHDAHKHYFGELEKRTKAAEPPAPPKPAPKTP